MSYYVSKSVVFNSPVKHSQHMILLTLSVFAHHNSGGIWYDLDAITRYTRLDKKTVRNGIRALIKKGLLVVEKGKRSPLGNPMLRMVLPETPAIEKGRKQRLPSSTVPDSVRYPELYPQVEQDTKQNNERPSFFGLNQEKISRFREKISHQWEKISHQTPIKPYAAQEKSAPVKECKRDIKEVVVEDSLDRSVSAVDHHHFSENLKNEKDAPSYETGILPPEALENPERFREVGEMVRAAIDELHSSDQSEETSAIFGTPDFDVSDVATPIKPTLSVEEFRGAIAEDDYMNDDIDDVDEVDDLDVQDDTFDVGSIIRAAPSVNRLRGGVAEDNEDTELQEARPRKKKGKKLVQSTRENLARFFGRFTDQLLGEVSKKHGFERSAWLELNAEQIEEARVYSTEKRREGKNFRTVLIARLDDLAAASLPQKPRKSVSKRVRELARGTRIEVAGKKGVGTIEGNANTSGGDPIYWVTMDNGDYFRVPHRDITVSDVPAPVQERMVFEEIVGTKWRYNACGTVVTALEQIGNYVSKTDDGKRWVLNRQYLEKIAVRIE